MKEVNEATQNVLENFRRKASELPFDAHPYSANRKALKQLGLSEWDDEHRAAACKALTIWVVSVVGNSIATVLNEIVALMQIANEGDEEQKKAAVEMSTSMNFVESMAKGFMHSIDFDYIAEQMFEEGLKIEKERAEEEAAAEAAKAKVKAFAAQKKQAPETQPTTGKLHKWQPSVN
jgi:hypothetical protein